LPSSATLDEYVAGRPFERHRGLMKRSSLLPLVVVAFVARCGSSDDTSNFDGGNKNPDATTDGNPFPNPDSGPSTYSDFPPNPIVDPSLPSNTPTLFGS